MCARVRELEERRSVVRCPAGLHAPSELNGCHATNERTVTAGKESASRDCIVPRFGT